MVETASNDLKNKDKFVYPECEWGYRLMGVLTIFFGVFLLCAIAVTFRDNVLSLKFQKFVDEMYRFSSKHGMNVNDVIVEGNYRTSYDDLVQALNLSENESILGVDIFSLQERIEQLTWVRNCVIKRSFFPNNILIDIKEREVRAIWQYEGRYYPIDTEGNVIEVEDFEPDRNMLVLTGEEAPHHMVELLKVLETDGELYSRVKAAIYVSKRRWDLIFDNLDNGVIVKLPEKNFDKAYQKIALLNKRQGIFKRKLTSFDLRYENRFVVEVDKSFRDFVVNK
ncbi:MAG: FtsQ-type POTRA domain-containing protein [Alphaproteobacteria bacterium]|nr:FtsQ-type POTRA domain-containing protein [Alphaproteobacteria bacterium]